MRTSNKAEIVAFHLRMKQEVAEPVPGAQRSLRVLLVSTADLGGGAELSAWSLFQTYRRLGHKSWLAVGNKHTDDPNVVLLPPDDYRNPWARFWIRAGKTLEPLQDTVRGSTRIRDLFRWLGEPRRCFGNARGYEDFDYPATQDLPKLADTCDLVHCYNLHGGYFDLRALEWLSRQRPVVLDLRDAWLLSGHCAHSFDCERWKVGCGECPDLKIYPSIRRDATAFNWKRKQEIFSRSRLFVATPSQWMMSKALSSMLAPAILDSRVIPTGVDLTIFYPAEKSRVRSNLNIAQNTKVLLFAANGIRRNRWKDYPTMRAAVTLLAEQLRGETVLFLALGETAPPEQIGPSAYLRFVPHLKNTAEVACYFQAADVYLHAAAADTFPRSVLEALACGTPVVATNVGGIPEQVRSVGTGTSGNGYSPTGILVAPGDPESMALAVKKLLTDEPLWQTLSANAVDDARNRFDVVKQAHSYLQWYTHLLDLQTDRHTRIINQAYKMSALSK
jgi:glycosyltransferase involved in cell wall biosynthesis